MAGSKWGHKLRRVPLLGGVVAALSMVRDIYNVIGWTDPGYHSVRSNEERLEEARRVAAIGNPGDGDKGKGDAATQDPHADQQNSHPDAPTTGKE